MSLIFSDAWLITMNERREVLRHRSTESGAAAGDDDGLSGEVRHARVLSFRQLA